MNQAGTTHRAVFQLLLLQPVLIDDENTVSCNEGSHMRSLSLDWNTTYLPTRTKSSCKPQLSKQSDWLMQSRGSPSSLRFTSNGRSVTKSVHVTTSIHFGSLRGNTTANNLEQ